MEDVSFTLKEQFERRINSFLKGSVDVSINEYGSEYKLPHPNKIATWKKSSKDIKIPYMLNYNNGRNNDPVYEDITDKNFRKMV